MKAIRLHEFGSPDTLRYEDIDPPSIGCSDVLIRVVAASVNPIDCKIRSGAMKGALRRPPPVVVGWDAAGVVESVGEAVTRFQPGDAVYTYPEFARGGTYAEFVAVEEAQVAIKPRTIPFSSADSLPMAGQAAWTAINKTGELAAGQTVLIHGAAGSLGAIAVQLARNLGARVIATASGESLDLVRSLGAEEILDYRTPGFLHGVRGVDLVVDTIGGATQEASWGVLKPGGLLVATAVPPPPGRADAEGVRAAFLFTEPSGSTLEQIARLVDAGKLRPMIAHEMALSEAARAHALVESRQSKGKIVLHFGARSGRDTEQPCNKLRPARGPWEGRIDHEEKRQAAHRAPALSRRSDHRRRRRGTLRPAGGAPRSGTAPDHAR
jgi:NADPH:quinone reductase-like Zn-dependent oxidoreductase